MNGGSPAGYKTLYKPSKRQFTMMAKAAFKKLRVISLERLSVATKLVVHPLPTPMTKIRFDNGITVTIRDGWVQTPSPTLIAILDTLAATLPGYGRIPSFSMRISTLRRDSPVWQALIRLCVAIRCRSYRQT